MKLKQRTYIASIILTSGALLILPFVYVQAGPICTGASCFVLGGILISIRALIYGIPVVIALFLIISLIHLKRNKQKKFILYSNIGIILFVIATGIVAIYYINNKIQLREIGQRVNSEYSNLAFPVQAPTGLETEGYRLIGSEPQKLFNHQSLVLHYRKGEGVGNEKNIILKETELTSEYKLPEKCYVLTYDFYSCKYFATTPNGTMLYANNQPAEYIFEKDGAVITLTMWMSDIKDTNKMMSIVDTLQSIPGDQWAQKLKEQKLL